MRWRQHQATILFAVSIPLLWCFGSMLLGARVAAYRDTAQFYYPLYQWTTDCWSRGEIPLWNPLDNLGTPVAAEATSAVFYPGQLLFALPLPFWLRFNLYLVGHLLLAGYGVLLFSHALLSADARSDDTAPMRTVASIFCAICYGLSGAVLFQYCNIVFLVGAAWLPFALLAALRMLQRRSLGWATVMGIFLALMVLGGDPQMAYHTGILAALLAWLRRRETTRDSTDVSAARPSHRRHALALLATAAVTGAILSVVQIVPAVRLTQVSERRGCDNSRDVVQRWFGKPPEGTHQQQLYDFSVAPWRLIECFLPNVSGRLFPVNQRWLSAARGEDRVWTPTLYLGLLPLLVALTMWRRRRENCHVRWLFWIAIGSLVASFGWYGPGALARETQRLLTGSEPTLGIGEGTGGLYWLMVKLLPGYAYFRYPAKLCVLTSLAVALLAGLGLQQAVTRGRIQLQRLVHFTALLSIVALGTFAVCGFWWSGWFAGAAADELFGPLDAIGAWHGGLLASAHALVLCAAVAWLLRQRQWSPMRLAQILLIATAVDLAWANGQHVATAPAELWTGQSVLAAAHVVGRHATADARSPALPAEDPPAATLELTPEPRCFTRVYRPPQRLWVPASWPETTDSRRVAQTVAWDRATLFPKFHLLDGVGSVRTFNTLSRRDYQRLLSTGGDGDASPQVLRLLGTRYLVLPSDREWSGAVKLEIEPPAPANVAVWEDPAAMPRAWIVHDVETWLPPDTLDRRTAADRFDRLLFPGGKFRDFRGTAVVESDSDLAVRPPADPDSESCQVVTERACEIQIEATLSSPGLVVLSNQYDPGWRVDVTSDSAAERYPIVRANGVMQGVLLPAGRHTLVFRYAPRAVYVAGMISLAAWLACAAWGVFRYRR